MTFSEKFSEFLQYFFESSQKAEPIFLEIFKIKSSRQIFSSQMILANKFYATWRDLMENKSDPRTTNWPLMDSPLPTIVISLTYIFTVTVRKIISSLIDVDQLSDSDHRTAADGKQETVQCQKASTFLQHLTLAHQRHSVLQKRNYKLAGQLQLSLSSR